MTATQPVGQQTTNEQPARRDWILSMGEQYQGGRIIGIYATRDLGLSNFVASAKELREEFTIDDAHEADDGSLHYDTECDWVSLKPYTVTTHKTSDPSGEPS